MRILLTGFQPFGKLKVNSSQLIVEHYQSQKRDDIIPVVLPTEYKAAGKQIKQVIKGENPDVIVMLGVAQRRTTISLERLAVNIDDAELPDNAGVVKSGELIVKRGKAAFWSTLPLKAMQEALEAQEMPVMMSNHAGTFVCNHTFYVARHTVESLEAGDSVWFHPCA